MTASTRLFEHTDWLLLLLRLLLVGLAIALALAPSLAGGTPTLGQASASQTVLMGSGPADVVAWVTSAPALPPAEPPPGAPPPDFWPGSDCAVMPGGLVAA
jgi:hypothetical protein